MGIVYKAGDTRLHRQVALKFLPEEVSKNPQALERFQREAKLLASLNGIQLARSYERRFHFERCCLRNMGVDASAERLINPSFNPGLSRKPNYEQISCLTIRISGRRKKRAPERKLKQIRNGRPG
jgi:hypothetical protein